MSLINRLKEAINTLEEFGSLDANDIHTLLWDCQKELELLSYKFDKSKYVKLPTQEKPNCKAKVYQGVGKLRDCNRTASHNSDYCFSHKNYNA